jgi:outer membrane protein assembly factor BamB
MDMIKMMTLKTIQTSRRWALLAVALVASLLLSACSGAGRIAASSWPGFTVDGETVYVAYGQAMRALKLQNGNQIWQYPVEADRALTFFAAPVVMDGRVVAGDYTQNVYSLDQATGALQWKFADAEKRFIAPGLVVEDLYLMPSADGTLYALTSEGKLAWSFTQSDEALWAQPVYDGEKVYLASMDHFVYALQVSEKAARLSWSADLGGAMVSKPALGEDGNLYVGTMTHEMIALSPNGKVLWRFDTNGAVWATPVVHEGLVMFGDLSGTIYALNAANGRVEWTISVDGPVIGSGALLEDGVAFGIEKAGVQAISFQGVKQWSRAIDGEIQAGLVQAGEFVLVGITNGDRLIIALDPASGVERWSFTPSK